MFKTKYSKIINIIIVIAMIFALGGIVFLTLFFPAKKLSADDNILADGVYFKAGKTDIRKGTLSIPSSSTSGLNTYTYDYQTFPEYYSKTNLDKNSNGHFVTSTDDKEYSNFEYFTKNELTTLPTEVDEKIKKEYIPQDGLYFNRDGNYYSTFSTTTLNNDFVILNNDDISNNSNIENLYLAFGKAYERNNIDNIENAYGYLNSLQVSGTLSNELGLFNLSIEAPKNQKVTINNQEKNIQFWYQYLDLKNLQAYAGQGESTKSLPSLEGKYTFQFSYSSYDKQNTISTIKNYSFSFYLIDEVNHNDYPEIKNTKSGVYNTGKTATEYFYSQNISSQPVISYNAQKTNLSYIRNFGQINESITSSFILNDYTYVLENQTNSPHIQKMGTINYYLNNSTTPFKNVEIKSYIDPVSISPKGLTIYYDYYLSGKWQYRTKDVYLCDVNNIVSLNRYNSLAKLEDEKYSKPYNDVATISKTFSGTKNNILASFIAKGYLTQLINFDYDYVLDNLGQYAITYKYNTAKSTSNYEICDNLKLIDMSGSFTTSTSPVNEKTIVSPNLYLLETANGIYNAAKNSYTFSIGATGSKVDYTFNQSENSGTLSFNSLSPFLFGLNNPLYLDSLNNRITNNISLYSTKLVLTKKDATYILSRYSKQAFGLTLTQSSFKSQQNNAVVKTIVSTTTTNLTNNFTYSQVFFEGVGNNIITHSFGTRAVFNKNNSTLNTELKHNEFVSDFTYKFATTDKNYNNNVISDTEINSIPNKLFGDSKTKIISTNLVPIAFNYYGKYYYDLVNNKNIPQSMLYRCTNYTYDKQTNTVPSTLSLSDFVETRLNKDTYISDNGLYIIIVKFQYDYYKETLLNGGIELKNNDVFYQVFSFVIDNSSPQIIMQKQTQTGVDLSNNPIYEYKDMGSNKYTNKNVKITWTEPTYFESNITATLLRENYLTTSKTLTEYKNGAIIDGRDNGIYSITIKYGTSGNDYFTKDFVIDSIGIQNSKILPVDIYDDGKNQTALISLDSTFSSQLINKMFTYVYDKKLSGAKISTTYNIMSFAPITNTSEYGKLVSFNESNITFTGITTNYKLVSNDSILISHNYNYDYSYRSNGDYIINSANYFNPTVTTLYKFYSVDQAGNNSTFYALFDNSKPRYALFDENGVQISNQTSIINNTTTLKYGDYKVLTFDYSSGDAILNKVASDLLKNINLFNGIKIHNNSIFIPLKNTEVENNSIYKTDNILVSQSNQYILFSSMKKAKIYLGLPADANLNNWETSSFTKTIIKNNKNILFACGEAKYYYTINDILGNSITNSLWMNLDLVQAYAYASYLQTVNVNKAVEIENREATLSASQMYFTFLESSSLGPNIIPNYSMSYKFYPFNLDFYKDYIFNKIITNEHEKYYNIEFAKRVQSLDEQGNPKLDSNGNFIYTIDLTSTVLSQKYYFDSTGEILPDSEPNPFFPFSMTVTNYSNNMNNDGLISNYYKNQNGAKRLFSNLINPSTTSLGTSTTQGMYVFKRQYEINADLSATEDIMTRYYVYYIDRGAIISVDMNSNAENLWNVGNSITFDLGVDTKDTEYQTKINSKDILGSSNVDSSIYSNSSITKDNLFNVTGTNKTLVQFNLPTSKYNEAYLSSIYKNNVTSLNSSISPADMTKVMDVLFKGDKLSNLFGLDLTTLYKEGGNKTIIKNNNVIYPKYINKYDYNSTSSLHNIQFSYQSKYVNTIVDKSGYDIKTNDGILRNNKSNSLKINFDITHELPTGHYFGKYYNEFYGSGDSTSADYYYDTVNKEYLLLKKYLNKMQNLSTNTTTDQKNSYIVMDPTNNNTLVFVFSITNDEYKAKIDASNITISQDNNIIFNRTNGICASKLQENALIHSTINGIEYYAIVIYDEYVDNNFKLIPSLKKNGYVNETIFNIGLQYVGNNPNYYIDYLGQQFYKSNIKITVDMNKPEYNLARIMLSDTFYNSITTSENEFLNINSSNYFTNKATLRNNFNTLYSQYNYVANNESLNRIKDGYFFSVNSDFTYKSISELDSTSLYYRRLSTTVDGSSNKFKFPENYYYSITPDEYEIFNNGSIYTAHPRFNQQSALDFSTQKTDYTIMDNNYYKFSLSENTQISMLQPGGYYEIIEGDKAGNFRVYGIYIEEKPITDYNLIINYKKESASSTSQIDLGISKTPPLYSTTINGQNLNYKSINIADLYKDIKITTSVTKEIIHIKLNANDKTIIILNNPFPDFASSYSPTAGQTLNDLYLTILNSFIDRIHLYVEENQSVNVYGYTVKFEYINRNINNNNINFNIIYNVPGKFLEPTFVDDTTHNKFSIMIPSNINKTNSTKIVKMDVFVQDEQWINYTNIDGNACDIEGRYFNMIETNFVYTFSKGIYKFVLTDNFGRTRTFFHVFGKSTIPDGKILTYNSKTADTNLSEKININGINYNISSMITYTSSDVTLEYDKSIFNMYVYYPNLNRTKLNNDKIYYDESGNKIGNYIQLNAKENILKYTFTADQNKNVRYIIKLVVASTEISPTGGLNQIYTYNDENIPGNNTIAYTIDFCITKIATPVEIYNLSGVKIQNVNASTNFSEDIVLNWTRPTPDFNSKLHIIRKDLKTKNILDDFIVNEKYTVTNAGIYLVKVISDIDPITTGYNYSSYVTFMRNDQNIVIYSVYKVDLDNSYTQIYESEFTEIDKTQHGDDDKTFNLTNVLTYNFYVQNSYFNFVGNTPDTSKKHIKIMTNTNKNIQCYMLSTAEDIKTKNYVVYRIYTGTFVYRYLKINFVADNISSDFGITEITDSESHNLQLQKNITSTSSSLKILFTKFNLTNIDKTQSSDVGNKILIDYFYNGKFLKTICSKDQFIKSDNINYTENFIISASGLHKFIVYDLASNKQVFGTAQELNICLVNNVIFTVNGETPINNKFFNGEVKLSVTSIIANIEIYKPQNIVVTATLNGTPFTAVLKNGELLFSKHGYYTITMTTPIVFNNNSVNLTTSYNFTIINKNIALSSLSIPAGKNFTLNSIKRADTDVTTEYNDKHNIWLYVGENNGNAGKYTIELKGYDISLKEIIFSFDVWINQGIPSMVSSIPFGTSTTNVINISYNPFLIYSELGNSVIKINDKKVADINTTSVNEISNLSINETGIYWIQIFSDNGDLIASYKVEKTEPLNTTSKILIATGVVAAIVVVILFIKLRKKTKVR